MPKGISPALVKCYHFNLEKHYNSWNLSLHFVTPLLWPMERMLGAWSPLNLKQRHIMHFDLYLYLHGLYERKIKGEKNIREMKRWELYKLVINLLSFIRINKFVAKPIDLKCKTKLILVKYFFIQLSPC